MPSSPAAPCPSCRALTWKHSRCTACGHTRIRNYGSTVHQNNRAAIRQRYPTGPCRRCGNPGSWTDSTDPLEAGHIDPDGSDTVANLAPEHRSCNRAAGRRDGFR